MKLPSAIAIGLFAACPHVWCDCVQAQAVRELSGSLQILDEVSHPMPDFSRVRPYRAFPDTGGRLVRGSGHSPSIEGWFTRMAPIGPKFVALDDRLGQDVQVYADTVREEGAKLLSETQLHFKHSLLQFDMATGGKLQELLGLYNEEVNKARAAGWKHDRAKRLAAEASYLLDASDTNARECNLLLEKSKLEADKAALLDRIKGTTAFVDPLEKAIAAMAADGPAGVVNYLGDKIEAKMLSEAKAAIVDAFYVSTRENLYEISGKIASIDRALQELKCQKETDQLRAARTRLEARMADVLLSFFEIVEHRANAWKAVDRMGTLRDRNGRRHKFFQQLQLYNAQINTMGRRIFESVNAYLAFLATDPLSRGDEMLALVDMDLREVQRDQSKRDPDRKWITAASELRAYLEHYGHWYHEEVRHGAAVLENLRAGRHLDLVDQMVARASKELGATVYQPEIVR